MYLPTSICTLKVLKGRERIVDGPCVRFYNVLREGVVVQNCQNGSPRSPVKAAVLKDFKGLFSSSMAPRVFENDRLIGLSIFRQCLGVGVYMRGFLAVSLDVPFKTICFVLYWFGGVIFRCKPN
jgi:hypothetical protein